MGQDLACHDHNGVVVPGLDPYEEMTFVGSGAAQLVDIVGEVSVVLNHLYHGVGSVAPMTGVGAKG